MKKVYSSLLCAAISAMVVQVSHAQAPAPGAVTLKAPAGAVTVDGTTQEWGDSLSYYNADKKIHYTLANDKTNIYLVVKTKDPTEQNDILSSGITLSADPKGRKKLAYSVTFPSASAGGPALAMKGGGEETIQQKALKASLTRLRKIKAEGFKDIDDENIATTNSYGIQVAMAYDDKGYLVYEEAVPIALFHAPDALMATEWSFNIRINGIDRAVSNDAPPATDMSASGGGGGKGGKGGGPKKIADPSTAMLAQGQSTPSIDFWSKYVLSPVK